MLNTVRMMFEYEPATNPLIPAILSVLRQHPEGVREYDLLVAVQQHPFFASVSKNPNLALFQKHFLLMNALYQLQTQLWQEENLILTISPLNIQLTQATFEGGGTLPGEATNSALQSYYLDWDNLNNTALKDVKQLLDDFWRRFINIDARQAAFEALGLEQQSTMTQIRQRYRELATSHHPDKGGDTTEFIKIREAYEVLKSTA